MRFIGHLEAECIKITTEPSNALCSDVATVSFHVVYPVCVASRAISSGNHTYFTFRWGNLYFERALNCALVLKQANACYSCSGTRSSWKGWATKAEE